MKVSYISLYLHHPDENLLQMSIKEKKQILNYLFENDSIPAEVMNDFSLWLLENEDDSETESLMRDKWEEYASLRFEDEDMRGLSKMREIILGKERKLDIRKKVIAGSIVVLSALLVFLSGILLSPAFNHPVKEITLVTAENSIGEFSLNDGTRVWLNGNSRLTYPEQFGSDIREVTLHGEGYFEVIRDENRPFVVNMPNVCIEVLGTSFGASCYEKGLAEEVVLKSGSVKVSAKGMKDDITLAPDQVFAYSPFDGNVSISSTDADNSYRWYEKCLTFENTRFGDVLENIEHRYRVDIKEHTSVSMDKRLSMTIVNEQLEAVMEVISTLLPISYEIHGNSLIIKDND
jgi:ferric-dicitrate binding protein FerR (iron transport regulator)